MEQQESKSLAYEKIMKGYLPQKYQFEMMKRKVDLAE